MKMTLHQLIELNKSTKCSSLRCYNVEFTLQDYEECQLFVCQLIFNIIFPIFFQIIHFICFVDRMGFLQ